MSFKIPYGNETLSFCTGTHRVVFSGEMTALPAIELEEELLRALGSPIGTPPLGELVRGKTNIVFLIEDNTRNTPLHRMLPVVISYLEGCGVRDEHISFLTAPGTHRIMTDAEIRQKVGDAIADRFLIRQHDANVLSDLVDLGAVSCGAYEVPVHVNKYATGADLLIGLGDIVPHSDAGFSGGAKIVQPGVCGFATTSATHVAAGLLPDVPLGAVENPCRHGMEEVAKRAGLSFIINTVKNCNGDVAGVFAGDFVSAHRRGAELARQSFSVAVPECADIVVVSAWPCDLDYWQALKGVTSAYFAVKEGGIIVFVSPCHEGLAHNHPRFEEWLAMPLHSVIARMKTVSPDDMDADAVSADLAVCNCRARERAQVFAVSGGLSDHHMEVLGYRRFATVQEALDEACAQKGPEATVGILPQGGVSLPVRV